MNLRVIETDQKERLMWALSQAQKKDSLPDPHGMGIVYVTEYRHGRVCLKGYKAIAASPTRAIPEKRKGRLIEEPYMHVTKDGQCLNDGKVAPMAVKDRVHHHFELYP